MQKERSDRRMVDYIAMGLEEESQKKQIHQRECAILGAENILCAQRAHEVWGVSTARKYHIPYRQSTLEDCAQKNAEGVDRWHLLFLFSWDIEQIIGKSQKIPMIGGTLDRCIPQPKLGWGKMKPRMGYHLCNLTPSLAELSQEERRMELQAISPQYSRARVVELAQILVGIAHLNPSICARYTCEVSKFSGEFQFGLNDAGLELDTHNEARGVMLMRRWDA
ncbi:MAG: hypothetical protein WC823_06845 [Parcubacteria group bacterium]|jgi:hypothetical protein